MPSLNDYFHNIKSEIHKMEVSKQKSRCDTLLKQNNAYAAECECVECGFI